MLFVSPLMCLYNLIYNMFDLFAVFPLSDRSVHEDGSGHPGTADPTKYSPKLVKQILELLGDESVSRLSTLQLVMFTCQ